MDLGYQNVLNFAGSAAGGAAQPASSQSVPAGECFFVCRAPFLLPWLTNTPPAQNHPKARERLEELKRGGARMQKTRVSRSNVGRHNEGECVVM